ncbi:amino acid kinase family protein [Methanofollis fontis]|uniref:UMP kinase n=1 Tax=Methanofollis fontis TaxID=2052832 RepID=A0A483CLB7_9EURY|nr:uridylate kinase [Methanofollis fontis]TAJ43581.1 uridylate kinase [Methanofollis fontis]
MKEQRFELDSGLRGETLVRKGLMKRVSEIPQIRIMPDLKVVKIGGHGTMDFGRDVVFPIVEELGALKQSGEKLLVVTGGGVRVRHIMDIGINLGMPTGVLAELAGTISEQNALMMSLLLSPHGGVQVASDDLLNLPTLTSLGLLPVIHGTPPYGLYEQPPEMGSIPPNRTDTGAVLIAEVMGAKTCILAKNVDGLYAEDPRLDPDAEFIPEITASELLARDMEDMVLEKKAVELLLYTKHITEIRVVNGHVPGTITKALRGERVGTVIRR